MSYSRYANVTVLAAALMVPTISSAGGQMQTTFIENSDTTLFAGISFVFGSRGESVEGILGVATGEIDLDGDVTGAKLSGHFGFADGVSFDKIKLTGLVGGEDVQAELGGGYSFKLSQPFAVVGANGDYVAVGADIFFDRTYEGYLTLHTIGGLSLETGTTGGIMLNPPPQNEGEFIESPGEFFDSPGLR